jgi:hypothetical protein
MDIEGVIFKDGCVVMPLKGHQALIKRVDELEERLKWLDDNSTFYEPNGHNKPALDSVSKRIWYHATDDTDSYPFSDVIGKALDQGDDITK